MTDEQILALTHGRLMVDLDRHFPMKKAPSVSAPEAFSSESHPAIDEDQREQS